jgi:hypothetical protein
MEKKTKKPNQNITKGDSVAPRKADSDWQTGVILELDCFDRKDGPRAKIRTDSDRLIHLMIGDIVKA